MNKQNFTAKQVQEMAVNYGVGGCEGQKRALCVDGAPRWYALTVAPQREDQAEAWLSRFGVYAFHPVTRRKVTRFGRQRVYHRRYLPGLVFARFPGLAIQHRVTVSPFITGALSRTDGVWGALDPHQLSAIHAMRKVDEQIDQERKALAARKMQAAALSRGDAALFRSGPFAEKRCEVVELRADGGVKVVLKMFSSDVYADVQPDDLVQIQKKS